MEQSADLGTTRDAAIEVLFRQHGRWIHHRLTMIIGDPEEAQDLVQQTFMRAAEHWPLPNYVSADRWLATVAIRLAIDEVRRRKRWGFLSLERVNASWAISADPDLWKGLSMLEARVRAALLLTILDGYSQEEVADTFGVRRGTVASWLSRARAQLQPILEVR